MLFFYCCYFYSFFFFFFFFNDTATTEIYTLSLHDALPISLALGLFSLLATFIKRQSSDFAVTNKRVMRSEEHTSELQSRGHLVCRLLLEKKKKNKIGKTKVAHIATKNTKIITLHAHRKYNI